MKIIHTGDVHLGSAFLNLPSDKAKLRNTELLDGFRRLTLYARENGIYAVLIAGDLFDGNRISAQLKREVLAVIAAAKPVRFFYVSGNHDNEFAFESTLPENLFLFADTHSWKSYDLPENVTLTGIDCKNMTDAAFGSLILRPQRFNVLLAHGEIAGNERRSSESVPLGSLKNKGVDYLALGHIHQATLDALRIDGRGHYRYCGCLEGRGFDECGRKGFFLLEIESGRLISETFLSLSKRTVCECRADISACNTYYDVERAAMQALSTVEAGSMVKLVLVGRHKAGLKKETGLLTQRLADRFFYLKTEDESRLFVDYNDFKNDKTERGEFVREVGRYEMNEDLRAEILDVGLKALAGESIDL